MKEWIPMYNNPNYLVNPFEGKIKSLTYNYGGRVLKGRILYVNKTKIANCRYYTIRKDGKKLTMKEHRIVAEAVLQRDLSGITIGHKNGLVLDNNFYNLIIGGKTVNARKIRVDEYFKGVYRKTYPSIRAFERETGISHKCFVKKGKQRILERYAYTFLIDEEY